MKTYSFLILLVKKTIHLMAGYALYGLGIVMTLNANQGLSPWDVFHQGLSNQIGITIGTASQIVGAAVVIMDILFNERIGWGTILNVIFIGFFVDLFMLNGFVPKFNNIFASYALMFAGMCVIALATFLYLSAQLGAGPRDGLMIALTKHLPLPVGLVRNLIELFILAAGYLMGGSVGFGTLFIALGMGRLIQVVFNLFKFDVRQVRHRYVDEDLSLIFNRLRNGKAG